MVDLRLRREGGEWKIDPPAAWGETLITALKAAMGPESESSYEQRERHAERLHRLLTVNGMGWTVAALGGCKDLGPVAALVLHERRKGTLTACKSNLKNLGTASSTYVPNSRQRR